MGVPDGLTQIYWAQSTTLDFSFVVATSLRMYEYMYDVIASGHTRYVIYQLTSSYTVSSYVPVPYH